MPRAALRSAGDSYEDRARHIYEIAGAFPKLFDDDWLLTALARHRNRRARGSFEKTRRKRNRVSWAMTSMRRSRDDTPKGAAAIKTADCVPVLIGCNVTHLLPLCTGWRGTSSSIVKLAIEKLQRDFGARAEDLRAQSVRPQMVAATKWDPKYTISKNDFHRPINSSRRLREGTRELILHQANRDQLIEAGISSDTSTLRRSARWIETTLLFYRREKQKRRAGGRLYVCHRNSIDASRAHCLLISAGPTAESKCREPAILPSRI